MKVTLVGQILIGSLILHQLFVVILLLTRREERKDHSLAMAIFFGANMQSSVPVFIEFFWPGIPQTLSGNIAFPFLFLLGPSICFYCRALVSPAVIELSRKDWIHLVPFFVAIVAVAIITTLMMVFPPDPEALANAPWPPSVILLLAVNLFLIALFVGATSGYLFRIIRLLTQYRRSKFDYFSSLEGRNLTWFEWMIGLLIVIWAINVIILLDDVLFGVVKVSPDVQSVIEMTWVYILSFMVLWQQAIFKPYRHWHPETGIAEGSMEPVEPETQANGPKYQRSALDDQRSRRIIAKIERAMSEDRLYRNQNFTLRNLSDHTRVSENYLSQVLNEQIGSNFYEYINHWRIKDACALLGESQMSIIEIGEEVGFNSRSTFNAAFKKETGLTPSDYRANLPRVA